MDSLKELCNDPAFPATQKEYFEQEVGSLLAKSEVGEVRAIFCLNQLWQNYDAGGISMRRSLRSCILEQILRWMRENNEISVSKAKTTLSILVAMYYDYEYINRHGWFDFRLHGVWNIPLEDRILVSAAAFALDIDEIPSLNDWNDKNILDLLNS